MKYVVCIVLSINMLFSADPPHCVVHFHMTNDICAMAQQKQVAYSVQTVQPCSDFFQKSMTTFARHKQKIVTLSTLSGMSIFYYRIASYQGAIRATVWGQWKAHLALLTLAQVPQDELIAELLMDIQRAYINPDNPTDALYPITTFTDALQAEWDAITNYIWWHTWCSRLYIARWLPFDKKLLENAPEQLQRLEFIQTMFRSWIARQNFISCSKGVL
jgi:hypothetical protein